MIFRIWRTPLWNYFDFGLAVQEILFNFFFFFSSWGHFVKTKHIDSSNFGRGLEVCPYEDHLCEIILNFGQQYMYVI